MKSKHSIKRILAAALAATMLFCGALTATASANVSNDTVLEEQGNNAVIYASEHLSSWSPLLSKTQYGAQVSFVGSRSGSILVELQNSSGNTIASFTESFSNRSSIGYTKARTTASGTYRIRITVTINGNGTTRTSSYMTI